MKIPVLHHHKLKAELGGFGRVDHLISALYGMARWFEHCKGLVISEFYMDDDWITFTLEGHVVEVPDELGDDEAAELADQHCQACVEAAKTDPMFKVYGKTGK